MTAQHLLDTHVLLWLLTDPGRLSAPARTLVDDAKVPLHVSAASAWEISTKQRLGKLPQAQAITAGYARHLVRAKINSLPITDEHALLAGNLDWDHRDPFDRMIAATAMIEGMSVITADSAFSTLAGVRTVW